MSPADLRAFRAKLKLSRAELAERLGVSVEAVKSWELGRRPIDSVTRLALEHLRCVSPIR